MFCYSMRDMLNSTMVCFLYVKQTDLFQCIIIHDLCLYPFMLQHSCFVLMLELHISCSCLEYFDPSFQCFANGLIKIVMVHVTSKIILFITYLLEDEKELSLGMLDTL